MTAASFVRPEDLNAVAALLKRSRAEVESEIRGLSMHPTLPPGARIRIRCTDSAEYRPGDVLAFLHRGGLMAHRLVRRGRRGRGRAYGVTRGDAFAVCDPPIPLATVVGLVTAWRPSDAEPWRPVAPPPPLDTPRRSVAAALDALIGGLVDLHPGIAHWVAVRALWVRGLAGRVARRLAR